jgi:hypothetical protein
MECGTMTHISKISEPASLTDYTSWLEAYLKKGGKVSNYHDSDFSPEAFRRLTVDGATLPTAYTNEATALILPQGMHVNIKELGQNSVYRL